MTVGLVCHARSAMSSNCMHACMCTSSNISTTVLGYVRPAVSSSDYRLRSEGTVAPICTCLREHPTNVPAVATASLSELAVTIGSAAFYTQLLAIRILRKSPNFTIQEVEAAIEEMKRAGGF